MGALYKELQRKYGKNIASRASKQELGALKKLKQQFDKRAAGAKKKAKGSK